ncbi:hypothetical protein AMTRI_Chr03g52890 [Amborella trichopoda]
MAISSGGENARPVCVMDASGHLGIGLVERLLKKGYSVHAAVQNGDDGQILRKMITENENLKVFGTDMMDYHSIIDAIKGCSGLFYAFKSPMDQSDYDEFSVETEVMAAHNVLEACAQTESMERVVFTSSVTAVVWKGDKNQASDVDERDWSDPNLCRKFKLWHGLAKTLAERTAWALAMDRGVDMVSINSGLLTRPQIPLSHPYLKGAAEMYEGGVFVTVDIGFLVDAHICVYENPSAYGRYICFNQLINRSEDAARFARMLRPPVPSPPSSEDSKIYEQRITNKKLNKLMVDFEREDENQQCI